MSPLQIRNIGPYEVLSLIGVGGMGEVYKARDTRLDRTVALKILPLDVAHNPDRMHRFIMEAKAASALSHRTVATIYNIGQSDGITFIAMEYVEGETLAEKMKSAPMGPIEIRTIARQAAEALVMAHSKGITHRDIKPANLMVTPRGQLKVLDFGLAKITRPDSEDVTTIGQTLPGMLMGTVAYMSPEQALGHEVDHRTDIFSLGIVLYEMGTGRSPFWGRSIGEMIDRILHTDPEPVSSINPLVPAQLEHVIHRCLEKDRDRRYASARELLRDLREHRVTSRFSRTLEAPGLPQKWIIGFAAIGLIVWIATLTLIVSKRIGNTRNHRSTAPIVKSVPPASPGPQLHEKTETLVSSPKPDLRLLFPAPDEVIPQNRADIGCPEHPFRGHGLLASFRWQTVPGAESYRLLVKQNNASMDFVDTVTRSSSYEIRDCNAFVIDRNAAGTWRVEALDRAGRVIVTSQGRSFRWGPCRLSSGVPCSAPPPQPGASSPPRESATQQAPVERRTQVFQGNWDGAQYALGIFTVEASGPVDATVEVSGLSGKVRLTWLGLNTADARNPCSAQWLTNQVASSPYLGTPRATWHWASVPPGSYCLNVVPDLNSAPRYQWTLTVVHP